MRQNQVELVLEDELLLIQQKFHLTDAIPIYDQEDNKSELGQSSSKLNVLISDTNDKIKQSFIKANVRKSRNELQKDSLLVKFLIKPIFIFIYKFVDFYHNTQSYEKRILEFTNDKHPAVVIIFRWLFGMIGFIIGILMLLPIYEKIYPVNQNDSNSIGFLTILVCEPFAYIGHLIGSILGYRLHKLYYYLKQQWYE
jgi:hypothetical protein